MAGPVPVPRHANSLLDEQPDGLTLCRNFVGILEGKTDKKKLGNRIGGNFKRDFFYELPVAVLNSCVTEMTMKEIKSPE